MKLELISELMREVAAHLQHHEAYYHNAYVGYLMSHACPAISGEFGNCMIVVAEIIKEAIGLHTEDSEIALDVVVDTMLSFKYERLGPSSVVIVYWPNLPTLPLPDPLDADVDDFGD